MKKILPVILAMILMSPELKSQDSTVIKPITFRTKVFEASMKVGYLSAFSDSALFLSNEPVSFSLFAPTSGMDSRIDYQNLKEVHLKRKGSFGRGLLIGSISGAVTGAILGFASGNDFEKNTGSWCILCMTAGQKAAAYSFLLGTVGGITGGIVGATARKKFIIAGRKDNFNNFRTQVLRKAAMKK